MLKTTFLVSPLESLFFMFKVMQKIHAEKFDFDRFKRRHVLLRVSYFGWDYMGFATQVDINTHR